MEIVDWVAIFQYVLVIVLGVPGNGLVLWITTFKMKYSVNTIWFQNLAAADLLCCLSAPFNIMYVILGYWPLGLIACKFISFLLFMNMYASVLLLTMIIIDRCLLVMKPVWCQNKRTVRKAHVICVVIWIRAAILSIPRLIFHNILEYNGIQHCSYDYGWFGDHNGMVENFIAVYQLIIGFAIPFLVIIVCYTLLIHRVKFRFAHHTKTMKVAIAVIIGFFVCWFPYNMEIIVFLMLDIISPPFYIILELKGIFLGLAFMNSCINPVIYVLMGRDSKSKAKRSFKGILKNVLEEEILDSDSNTTNLRPETKEITTSL